MRVISLLNFKGGVGKTTSTHSIAAGLSLKGKKVLAIDMDPQGTLTFFSRGKRVMNGDTREVLFHEKSLEEAITQGQEFDFIGANIKLATSDLNLNNSYNKEQKLKRAINNMSDNSKYDFILIDCPPSLSIFTLNALTASTDLLIPCECELASMEGVDLLLDTIKEPIEELNDRLNFLGILPTKLDGRKNISKEAFEALKVKYDKVLPPIRINSKLSELGLNQSSIFALDKNSNGAKDYMKVVDVILNGEK
jgi:chromosome partitioning protein